MHWNCFNLSNEISIWICKFYEEIGYEVIISHNEEHPSYCVELYKDKELLGTRLLPYSAIASIQSEQAFVLKVGPDLIDSIIMGKFNKELQQVLDE